MDNILEIKQWLCNHLDCRTSVLENHHWFSEHEAIKLKLHALWMWDNGAWRTLWHYYRQLGKSELESFLFKYFLRYYHVEEYWVTRNPSAAVVALCRELGYS